MSVNLRRADVIVMPKLGLTMTEGLVSSWVAETGIRYTAGDVIALIETDKVASEIVAPGDGTLGSVEIGAGEVAAVGTVLAHWLYDAAPNSSTSGTAVPTIAPFGHGGSNGGEVAPPTRGFPARKIREPRIVATPLARRVAAVHEIDLSTVAGTGPGRRIKAADVRVAQEARVQAAGGGSQRIEALSPAAKKMADLTAMSKREIPHFYLMIDVEITELERLRRTLNRRENGKFTINQFIIAAAAKALALDDGIRRVWRKDGIVRLDSIDIGVAIATDRGLVNPVVRKLEQDNFFDVSRKLEKTVLSARTGQLMVDDFGGGATTVSNAGMYGVRYVIPIIVPGQSSILGIGAAVECFRPDAQGNPALRREIGIVMSADHRVHTGVAVARYLQSLRTILQDPLGLILQQPVRSMT
jgi:pyruvate dehydrogenase E2 component (dihydrolipoamide acetyltransferase)